MQGLKRMISLLLAVVMLSGIAVIHVNAEGDTPDYGTALKFGTDNIKYSDGVSITIDGTAYSGQDFRTWLQYDSRWGSVQLGSSETIGHVGCLVTAITKLIIEAGLASPEELTPDVLVKYLNDNSGFDGNALVWSKVSEFCQNVLGKDFTLVNACYRGLMGADSTAANRDSLTLGTDVTYAQMIGWINQGYHLLLQVNKNAGHWIAVDEWETLSRGDGQVYVMDSWRNTMVRHGITLEDYLTANFGTLYSYPAGAVKFSRIAVYSTDLSDTDNANYKEYDTDFIGYQDYNYTYRNWSRYDSRWATTELDVPVDNKTADYVGEWGQALLSLTKTLIEAGAVSESMTPNDVLSLLRSKSLIGSESGIISWGSLSSLDNVTASTAGSSTATITAAAIRSNILSGKHHILRAKETGSDDMAWLAVDEPRIMASVSSSIPVLDSGKSLDDNAGNQTISGSLYRLHTLTTSTTPAYCQLSYSGTNVSGLTASYTLGSDTITVESGGYVPAGTQVTLSASPDTGYSGIDWSSTGSTGTPGGTRYTVTVSEDTAVTAAGTAGAYNITYTTETDTCGFTYGANPSTAVYGSSVTFTVSPATSGYTVTVSSDDAAVTDNGDNTYTIASMPAKNVRINVSASFSTYTVYLDASGSADGSDFDSAGVEWYAYTWAGTSGEAYDEQWVKANPAKTAAGYYQFDNIRSRVIFVRVKNGAEFDTTKSLGEVIADYTGDAQVVYNQTDDLNVDQGALYTITAWKPSGWAEGHLQTTAVHNAVYLYTRYEDLRYTEGSYYAWTWDDGQEGSWLYPVSDEKGILRFNGPKTNIIFVKMAAGCTAPSFSESDFIGQTDNLTVAADTNDMFVIKNISSTGSSEGYWGNRDGVTLDYSLWARDDSRWQYTYLNSSTDMTGDYFLAQAIAKLAIQAGLKDQDEWDVTNAAWEGFDSSGNISYTSVANNIGLTDYTSPTTYTNTAIYRLVLKEYHLALKITHTSKASAASSKSTPNTMNEWVAVDEAKTLETGEIWVWRSKFSEDQAESNSCTLNSILAESTTSIAVQEIKAFKGGTTPYMTRGFDYRRWGRYDGRWVDNPVGNSENMDTNGACIIAISKMFVQAGVLSDDDDGDGVYDAGSFDRTARTGDFTPEDLRAYLAGLGVSDTSSSAGLMTDGSVYWAKVNGFVNNTLEFATTASSNGVIYLKFDGDVDSEGTDANIIGTNGYGRKASWSSMYAEMTNNNITSSTAYVCSEENDKIMKALLQGYHMLIEVPSKAGNNVTWVVVDEAKSLETGTIYVMDSEPNIDTNADTTLVDDYRHFYRIVGYKGATVPLPTEYTTPDGDTLISPHLEPSVYYDTETAKDGESDCYRILYNSGSYLTVQVGGAVVGKSYVMNIDEQEYEVPATTENTKNGILSFIFDGTAANVTNTTAIPLNDPVTNTELTKEIAVKCKYEKDGTVTYSNTVTGKMYYKMYAVYEFKYRPRRGGDEAVSTIRVPCEYEFLDGNIPRTNTAAIASHIPSDSEVNIYKECIDWSKAGITTATYVTTISAKAPADASDPAQYPDRFTLTYYYYDASGNLTQSETVRDVPYNTQAVDLRDTGVLDNKPAGASEDDVFLGWYEAELDGEELVVGDRCLSTLERFGMVITRNTMIAPKFGTKASGSDWAAYIDENTVTAEKSDDANGGHMYADFLVRYLNAGGTGVAVPDDAVYGVLFVYSSDDLANTSAKSAATLKAYATHSGLLSGSVGNISDGSGHSMKVANAKASSLSELNRVSIAVQNSYNNFKGCHYTAYAYITYTDSGTGAKVTALSSPVTGSFPV